MFASLGSLVDQLLDVIRLLYFLRVIPIHFGREILVLPPIDTSDMYVVIEEGAFLGEF